MISNQLKKEMVDEKVSITNEGLVIPEIKKSAYSSEKKYEQPYYEEAHNASQLKKFNSIVEESFKIYKAGSSDFISDDRTHYIIGSDWGIAYDEDTERNTRF